MRIEIVQNGRVLRQINHEGQSFVEAPPEGAYTIRLTNTKKRFRHPSGDTGRQLAVISVDGVNIVDGEEAGFDGPGYVVLAGHTIDIPGWRRSDTEVAKFEFKPQEGSYSAQTGKGISNTGVIGVAIFNEQPQVVKKITRTTVTEERWEGLGATAKGPSIHDRINKRAATKGGFQEESSRGMHFDSRGVNDSLDDGLIGAAVGASAACSADSETYSSTTRLHLDLGREIVDWERSAAPAPKLGTGYGQKAAMYTTETTFHRISTTPDEVITIQYTVRAMLQEWGVPLPSMPPKPSAFPASQPQGVPAPPGWNG